MVRYGKQIQIMCLYPRLMENRKYKSNKKNGGVIPTVKDERVKWVSVGCGKCSECMGQKKREWQTRLNEEIRHDNKAIFVTLTLSNESYENLNQEIADYASGYIRDNLIATLAVRRFLERWRKQTKKSVKHWITTELGEENGRIHLHGLIWGEKEKIEKHWQYGHIFMGEWVNEQTVNYIVKYLMKLNPKFKEYTPKILTSKGIGKNYLDREDSEKNKYKSEKTNELYKTRSGIKLPLPIYYRNKIYTDEEKELLWIEKLDKMERYVKGEKIDISENEKEYEEVRDYYRLKDKRLGFGDDSIDWNKKKYNEIKNKLKYLTKVSKQK